MTIHQLLTDAGWRLSPQLDSSTPKIPNVPEDYLNVLSQSNGFMASDQSFQLFGLEEMIAWNRSEMKAAYQGLSQGMLWVGQDAFGDQYGYAKTKAGAYVLIKFYCEGGGIERLNYADLEALLQAWIAGGDDLCFDTVLFQQVVKQGSSLADRKHFAFELPLVAGGEYKPANLKLESWEMHLGLLGQMSVQNQARPDGSPVEGFTST